MTTTATNSEELFRRVFDAFEARDFDTVAELHASDVVLHEDGETYRGYDAVEEYIAAGLADNELEFTIHDAVADEGTAACRYTVGPAGADSGATCLGYASVEDGAFTEIWVLTG
jgi:ketosteroid isomerase-like protein